MTDNKKSSNRVNIKILGTGCPNCQKLEANTKQALEELKIEAQVEKVTEIQDIMSYGVLRTPALVINEEVEVYGRVPEVKEIKELLTK
jgi:small redox-active disulfide protein 2